MSIEAIPFTLSTGEFAVINMVKAQSVRARVSRFGSYFGINPVKLVNGRTAWPHVQVRSVTVSSLQ